MELLDLGGYPEIYADGIAAVQVLGCCARVLYFTFVQSPSGVFRQQAVVSIVRPMKSFGQLHKFMAEHPSVIESSSH